MAVRKLDLIRLADAAAELGVGVTTLRRWITDGRIKGYRTGPRLIQVDRAELAALVQPLDGAA